MLKWYGRPVQHTAHEHKTEDTPWKLLFGDHEPRRQASSNTRTHTHTPNTCLQLWNAHAGLLENTYNSIFSRCYNTHRHTGSHIFQDNKVHTQASSNTHALTHTHTSLFAMLECAGRPVRTNSHTHSHHTHTHTHTHTHIQRALSSWCWISTGGIVSEFK